MSISKRDPCEIAVRNVSLSRFEGEANKPFPLFKNGSSYLSGKYVIYG